MTDRKVLENGNQGVSGLFGAPAAASGVTALSSPTAMEPASGLHPDGLQSAGARPLRNDPAIREKALLALAEECARWAGEDSTASDWVRPLSKVMLHGNGFDIAKELHDYHHVVGIDVELVEILDGASSSIWQAHREAVVAWVTANNIRPALALGDRISCQYGEGRINGFSENTAEYLMVPDGETEKFKRGGGGVCVPYEDASGIEAATADETRSGSAEGESPVPEGQTPYSPSDHPGERA